MEELSALDTLFLHLEDRNVALHIGATAIFEGPPPTTEELAARYEQAIQRWPRYRQLLRRTPLELRRPRWVDAGDLDLRYHLRRTALPAPGGPAELEWLVGRLMSNRLDPDRPLWEAWLVEGLDGGRWALVVKVHHSLVDGLGGMALFGELLDDAPPSPRPRATDGSGSLGGLLDAARAPQRLLGELVRTADGMLRYIGSLRPTAPSSLTGPLGRPRRYRMLTVDLDDVGTVRAALGGTVNDVALAMVSRGFRGLLLARGEPPRRLAVRCLVPVATRTADEAHAGANKISVLLPDLPVDASRPAVGYELIREQLAGLKSSGQAQAGGQGFAAANLLPEPLVAATMSLLRRLPQRVVTTVATNVPGPRRPQSLLGRPMLALYPYVPIAERIQLAVALTSYAGRLHFGVTCDRTAVPDADVFVAAMSEGLAELVKEAASSDRIDAARP